MGMNVDITEKRKSSSTVEKKNVVPVTLQQERKEIKERLISLLKKIKRDK